MQSRPAARLAACALLAALVPQAAAAQSAQPAPAVAPVRTPAAAEPRFDTVPVVGGTSPTNYVTTLQAWLRGNPDRRVTSLASVLAYRDDASAFVIGSVGGDNARQSFDAFPTRSASANDLPYGNDLTTYADTHPLRRIVAFTGIPGYSGGLKGLVVLVEPR